MRWLRPEPGSPIRVAFWYFWYRGYRKSQHPPTPSPALTRASSAISADSVSDRRFAFLFDRGLRSASLNPILDRLLRQSLSRSLLQVSPVCQNKTEIPRVRCGSGRILQPRLTDSTKHRAPFATILRRRTKECRNERCSIGQKDEWAWIARRRSLSRPA